MPLMENDLIAFVGARVVAQGPPPTVAIAVKRVASRPNHEPILIFDVVTSAPVDLDLRGSDAEVVARLEPGPVKRSPGRPKLGVVPREVTLLPRHWDWLNEQPGGASVTLRKLVEAARASSADADRARRAKEAAYRFMAAMAGDRPGFEEAIRALFAGDVAKVQRLIARWPAGIRTHVDSFLGRIGS